MVRLVASLRDGKLSGLFRRTFKDHPGTLQLAEKDVKRVIPVTASRIESS